GRRTARGLPGAGHRTSPAARGGRGRRRRGDPPLGRLPPRLGVRAGRPAARALAAGGRRRPRVARARLCAGAAGGRRLQGARGAPRPLRRHQHAGVPGQRRAGALAGDDAADPDPRHHRAEAAARTAAGLRPLRLRVRGAGPGAARHHLRRPARRAGPDHPAGGAAVRPARAAAAL
ncbi:MAG: hypothetical protein AVDCRST_MAG36-2235, partial [uncultured Nocardioidaceae bacterium]